MMLNFVVIIWLPFFFLNLALHITAQLSASVPQDVKYISRSVAPIRLATFSLAIFNRLGN